MSMLGVLLVPRKGKRGTDFWFHKYKCKRMHYKRFQSQTVLCLQSIMTQAIMQNNFLMCAGFKNCTQMLTVIVSVSLSLMTATQHNIINIAK